MLSPVLGPVLRLLVETCELPEQVARGYLLRWQAENPGLLALAHVEDLEGRMVELLAGLPEVHPRLAARALVVLADEIDAAQHSRGEHP